MKIIFSPAKKMIVTSDLVSHQQPYFLSEANELLQLMKSYSIAQRKKIWQVSETLFAKANEQLNQTDSMLGTTPALFAYQGLAFQHLAPNAMGEEELRYLEKNLIILSGMYGALKPMDAVTPYRLELKDYFPKGSLYTYWNQRLKDYFGQEEIINVASKEYSDAILKNYPGKITNILFGHLEKGILKTKGTLAKMGRGDLIYSMAERQIERVEDLRRNFDQYVYREDLSDAQNIVYLYKDEKKGA